MGLRIINPGMLTTVQDLGRWGFQKAGIMVSGAMDTVAMRIGNILLGNEENTACLEITLGGAEIYFEKDHLISLTGAYASPQINGKLLRPWRPIHVKKGKTLSFGHPEAGCRTYLAIAGGFDVPPVLNSASTYLGAKTGGFYGRGLEEGDQLRVNLGNHIKYTFNLRLAEQEHGLFSEASWTPAHYLLPPYRSAPAVRIVPGPEYEWFTKESQDRLWKNKFFITSQSDRMGYRLSGRGLRLKREQQLLSAAVGFGTVQVPPDGNPIILMADHPTTGGYPRIGQLATADLPILAQLTSGKTLTFEKITLQKAHELLFHQERQIELIKRALHHKITTVEK